MSTMLGGSLFSILHRGDGLTGLEKVYTPLDKKSSSGFKSLQGKGGRVWAF